MTSQHKSTFLISAIFLFFFSFLSAETILDNDFGFSLDIPEGFKVANYTEDGMSYHFSHPNIPVNLVMKINNENNISKTEEILKFNMDKLKASSQIDNFLWNKKEVSIATFKFTLDDNYSGWAVSTPTSKNGYFLTLICYSPVKQAQQCEQFIISTLNSLCIDENYYNYPGIITSYAYPKEGEKEVLLNIGGKRIKSTIDKVDEEASQFVVDLEYAVLTLYAKHNSWKEAWQRYYRMIYRDSFGRLENVTADVYYILYPLAKKQNPENPDICYAQYLLSWVQTFNYKRDDDPKKADFTCLPAVLTGTGNDCDSRSLLICTFLKAYGTECLLLVSPEYSHAMAAAKINALGQQYEIEETHINYIMGETTAKVTWGTIARDHADRTKWFHVILP